MVTQRHSPAKKFLVHDINRNAYTHKGRKSEKRSSNNQPIKRAMHFYKRDRDHSEIRSRAAFAAWRCGCLTAGSEDTTCDTGVADVPMMMLDAMSTSNG